MEKIRPSMHDTMGEREHTRPDTKVRGGRHERGGRHRAPTRGTLPDQARSIAHSFVSVEQGRHIRPSVFPQGNEQLPPPVWRTSEPDNVIRASDLAARLSPQDRAAGRYYPPSPRAEELRDERLAQGGIIRASDLAARLSPQDRAAGRYYPPSPKAESLASERLEEGGGFRASDIRGLLTAEDRAAGRQYYPRNIEAGIQEMLDQQEQARIREVGNISLDAPAYMDQQRAYAEYGVNLPVFLFFSVAGSNDVWAAFKMEESGGGRHHQSHESSLLFAKFDPNTRRFNPYTQRELVRGEDELILEHNTEGADPIAVHLHLDESDNILRFGTNGTTELHVVANPGEPVAQEEAFADAA